MSDKDAMTDDGLWLLPGPDTGQRDTMEAGLWRAVLGPGPDDHYNGHSPGNCASWPAVDEGPHNGVFWFRWIERQVTAQGATVEAAQAVRATLRRELQSGRWNALAVQRETGLELAIERTIWQASDDTGRVLWWSALRWQPGQPEYPYEVYLIDPAPLAPPSPFKAPSEKNPNGPSPALTVSDGLRSICDNPRTSGRGGAEIFKTRRSSASPD